MAAPARVRTLSAAAAAIALAAAALWVPATPPEPPASQPPAAAAGRAEDDLPSLGLPWGKVRGWERVNDGWTLTWQPAHGMWLVRCLGAGRTGRGALADRSGVVASRGQALPARRERAGRP